MIFDIHYELAAVGFLAVALIAFCRQKHLGIYRNQLFQVLMILVLTADCLDVIRGSLDIATFHMPMIFKQGIESLYMITHMTGGILYATYILAVGRKLDMVLRHKWKLLIPYFIVIIAVLTTPWTHFIYYYNENGDFCSGKGYLLLYIVTMLYVMIPTIISARYVRHVRRREFLLIYGVPVVLTISAILQQVLFHEVRLLYLVNCLIVFACFLFLQSSDYYLDEVTGFFKMHGFEEVVKERMVYEKESSILIVRIMNFNAMMEMYEDSRLMQIQNQMARIMTKQCKGRTFYHIAASTFAVISSTHEESEVIYYTLRTKLPNVWKIDGEEVVHDYCYYIVDASKECNNATELLQRVAYARSDHPGHHKPGELIQLSHEVVKVVEEKQKVADLIEQAIMDNSIEIYFQPIYSLEKDKITSVEVLARLKDREKNFINPEYFIRVAEESRAIIQLGEQIYRKACIFASQNHIFELGIEDININLSPIQCCYENLAKDLIRIAGEYDIPMSRMHLEITESSFMNRNEIMNTLEELCASGAKIALDDFGTGYSSMASIISLPVDFVKIDKSLVWSYGRGENQYLNQLVPMIQSEGKRIISEGIETEDHIDIFRKLKGDFLQGYYYSKPIPEQEFIKYLKEVNGLAN